MNDNAQDKPKMDIKRYNEGSFLEIDYTGKIILVTKDEFSRLKNKVSRLVKEKREWQKREADYVTEVNRLKNQLKAQADKHKKELAELKGRYNSRLTDAQRQQARADAFTNRQGKGRPPALTPKQQEEVKRNLRQLKKFGGTKYITDLEDYLVHNHDYAGGYESLRSYVSELEELMKGAGGR